MSGYEIAVNDDLDLDKIIDSGQCFRPHRTGCGTYRFISGSHLVDITDKTLVSEDKFKKGWDGVTVLSVSCTKKEWDSYWHRYFDLDRNYRKIRSSIPKEDDFLRSSARAGEGIRILCQDRFEMLISFIISQRKSIPAIRTCIEKIVALYGHEGFFPEPSGMLNATADELSSCGLGYRVSYIQKAVKRVALCEVDLEALDELSDEELFEELKSFAGVGDKVANCVELFAYHRTGRAPVDTWIKKVIEEKYNGHDPFPRYKENAGIMQQYMFYYAKVYGL